MKPPLRFSRFAGAIGLALIGLPLGAAADPVISNRAARPGEWGYHPGDGERAALNPPTFTWLHEPEARTYTVQWTRSADFSDAETAGPVPWNTYTHHTVFAPGAFHWRYRFEDAQGRISNWSRARTVIVPEEATPFPMPTVDQQRERVPSGHPRLFLRPEDLPRLRELATGREAARFEALRREADRILRAGPTPEPVHMGSARDKEDAGLIQYWWPNRVQTLQACEEAETLAFVHLITRDSRYGAAARRWILHLASWDPDGPTNFRMNCEAAKPLLHRLPRAYDWAWDTLTEADRDIVRQVMLRRATDFWEGGEVQRGVGHLNRPYGSHANRVWHKLAETGIAFLGELPEAATWLDYAVNKFYACYPVWSDDDGGWHEGVSYWGGYISKAVWWLQFADNALGIDGLKKPYFAHVADFPLYIAPPNSPNMGFGDLSYRPPSASWGGFMEFLVRAKSAQPDGERAAYWRWWMAQWGMRGQDGILGFLYAANLPPLPEPRAPIDLPSSKVFRGIGVASLHTTLLDSRDDVHFLFKSSPFGTQSHGHNPHNTFQLNAYGDTLLTTCVYRDLHGSKFHYQWAHSTMAHNGVLVNGEGQIPHTQAPHGRIVDFSSSPETDYLVGEAAAAYGDRLQHYERRVLFVKEPEPFLVLLDDLEATAPSTFQFMLHALAPFTVEPERQRLVVTQPNAGAVIDYLGAGPLVFRQWDGYTPPPTREFPNQWHLEAATSKPSATVQMLTLIVPHRSGRRPEVRSERLESPTALGVRVVIDGEVKHAAFRRGGEAEAASLDGRRFREPWAVW
ncbi:MAG: DUF4962 domain-containing protein [Verrucomicrobiales bacterium]|nr:DUF4962 domain-containing protein [Verrucomicrobiales bacterium]